MYKTTKCFFLSRLIATSLVMIIFLFSNTTYAESIIEYLTPTSDSSPAGLDFDSKGNLWFVEINGNKIGQGRENAKVYMSENPDIAKEITNKTTNTVTNVA